jgi:Helicase associated domain
MTDSANKRKTRWLAKFEELNEFYKIFNRFPTTSGEDGIAYNKLGTWCSSQKNLHRKGVLESWKEKKLNSLNFVWDCNEARWQENFLHLLSWRQIHPDKWPHQLPPKRRTQVNEELIEENHLGVWLMEMRRKHRNGNLSSYWENKMEEIDFQWDYRKMLTSSKFGKLEEFLKEKGRFPKVLEDSALYQYCQKKIELYRAGQLDPEYVALLDKYNYLEWIKNHEKDWDDWLEEVVAYHKEHRVWPASSHKYQDAVSLSAWLNSNKQKYNKQVLEQEKMEKLEKAGYSFHKQQDIWLDKLAKVKEFYQKQGYWPRTQAQAGRCEEARLGNWLLVQKNWYNGNLKNYHQYPIERVEMLKKIGFDLTERKRKPKEKKS